MNSATVWRRAARVAGQVLLGIWVFGTAFFFFVRFTSIFLHAHGGALASVLGDVLK